MNKETEKKNRKKEANFWRRDEPMLATLPYSYFAVGAYYTALGLRHLHRHNPPKHQFRTPYFLTTFTLTNAIVFGPFVLLPQGFLILFLITVFVICPSSLSTIRKGTSTLLGLLQRK